MGSRSRFTDGNIQFWDDKYHAAASAGVWATCPLAAFNGDPSIAYVYDSNWASFQAAEATATTLAGYNVDNATSGSATMPDSAGGVLQLNSLASTAEGVSTYRRIHITSSLPLTNRFGTRQRL